MPGSEQGFDFEIVQTFKIRRRGGRPRTWNPASSASLIWDAVKVKRFLEDCGKPSSSHAIATVLKDWPRYRDYSHRSLKSAIERRMMRPDVKALQSPEAFSAWINQLPVHDGKKVLTRDDFNLFCEALSYHMAEFIHSSK